MNIRSQVFVLKTKPYLRPKFIKFDPSTPMYSIGEEPVPTWYFK